MNTRANLLYTLLATFKRRKYSQLVDVGCFEVNGKYFLMQMQFDLDTNKKRFRRASMGWVNDYTSKAELYQNAKKYNAG